MFVNSSKYITYVNSPLSMPRHCSLLIVYNLKSQTKQTLLQLKARNKIYKGANRLGRRTGKWAKRHRGERKSRRNDSGVKRLRAKGKVGEATQG